MRKTLDLKNDVVFKILFAAPERQDVLIALLTAVLKPTSPICEAKVLNPEIPKALPNDRGAVLLGQNLLQAERFHSTFLRRREGSATRPRSRTRTGHIQNRNGSGVSFGEGRAAG